MPCIPGGWVDAYLISNIKMDRLLFSNARAIQFTGVFFVHRKLSHSRLVQLYGVCIQQKPLYIVTEFMENGCLLNYLRERKGKLQKALLLSVCQDICEGMAYLERNCYIHRDLVSLGQVPLRHVPGFRRTWGSLLVPNVPLASF